VPGSNIETKKGAIHGNDDEADARGARRDFLKLAGAGAVALGRGGAAGGAGPAKDAPQAGRGAAPRDGPYNILFILTDQERFFLRATAPGLSLPRTSAAAPGTTFVKPPHQLLVCTPRARCSIPAGTSADGDVRQHEFPVDLEHVDRIRTVGGMLREAGYYAAYKGKCT